MVADAPAQSALDRDTRLLSELLEETIAGQGGEGLRQAVVRLREAAARVRAGEPAAEEDAAGLVEEILGGDSLDVIRACSMELHLANLAETRERVRRRRGYERAEGPPQRESLAEAAERLAARASQAAARALDDLRLDLTLTAHPTEATRWSVMEHAGDGRPSSPFTGQRHGRGRGADGHHHGHRRRATQHGVGLAVPLPGGAELEDASQPERGERQGVGRFPL